MTEPTFGISITPVDTEVRAVAPADMSVIGLICTAPAADAELYPVDTPVSFTSDDATAIAALGSTGEAAKEVAAIAANTGGVAARIVFVRVTAGADSAATMTNIIGNAGSKTGLFAFKEAPALLGFTPRIIIVPGYTGITWQGVAAAVNAQGTSGANGTFALAFSGGTGSGAAGNFTVAGGKLTAISITNPGNYTVLPTVSFAASTGLTGATATLTLVDIANPVCAALGAVLDDLKAIAPVAGPDTTSTAAKAWRAKLNHKRLIPIDVGHKVMDGGSPVTIDPVGAFAGIQVARDAQAGGVPSKCVANTAVQGIVGLSRNVRFSLTDGAVDGQDLLANQVGITVSGSTADGSIADSGFVMIATDNAGDDDLWRFYHQVRLRDYIHLQFVKVLRGYLGRFSLTTQTVQAVINSMKVELRNLQVGGHILGFEVGFDPDANQPENLRLGRFNVFFKAEEPPILRSLGVKSYRYSEALTDLLSQVAA